MMSKASHDIIETEWSYFFDINDVVNGKLSLTISPDDEARARLAQRLGVMSVDSLKAELKILNPKSSMMVHIIGKIDAELTQACVVTLEPLAAEVHEDFEAWFADPDNAVPLAKARKERQAEKGHQEVPMLDESEDPEPIIDDKIDLGELVTQHLCLMIDPYPHAEGVVFEVGDDQQKDFTASVNNPFAALKDWKDKLGE
jgi:uncharacterized metal-binding protein YceD (DUF177 family)